MVEMFRWSVDLGGVRYIGSRMIVVWDLVYWLDWWRVIVKKRVDGVIGWEGVEWVGKIGERVEEDVMVGVELRVLGRGLEG